MAWLLDRSRPVLCFVHDARTAAAPDRLWSAGDAAWSRVDLVQVRGKALPAGALEDLVRGWIARLAGLPAKVIVNDRLDVAMASGADGAHLGRDDLPLEVARVLAPPGFLLGTSAHDRRELLDAQAGGADYAGLGAFFATRTKTDARLLDPAAADLARPVEGLRIPVLAIGGVTVANVGQALAFPAVTGVAVSGAIQESDDPGGAIQRLSEALGRAWEVAREAVAP